MYCEEVWNSFLEKQLAKNKVKTYPHLDPIFDIRNKKNQEILKSKIKALKNSKQSFLPFLKMVIETPKFTYQRELNLKILEKKPRPIAFASHFDTYVFAYFSHYLNKKYLDSIKNFDECVLAYRADLNGKCNIQFAKEAFDEIDNYIDKYGNCSVIALDIKKYFLNIDHSILKKMWLKVIDEPKLPNDQFQIFKHITEFGSIDFYSFLNHYKVNLQKLRKKARKDYLRHNKIEIQENPKLKHKQPRVFNTILELMPGYNKKVKPSKYVREIRKAKFIKKNKIGIPQGSSISALLSNIYLMNFDNDIYNKSMDEGFTYRRYCDDLLIVCKSNHVNELNKYLINKIKQECKLVIQPEKTDVVDFKQYKSGHRSVERKLVGDLYMEQDVNTDHFKPVQYLGFTYDGKDIKIRPKSIAKYFTKMRQRINKTVNMAYSSNSKGSYILKKQLYKRYTHFGKRNFITYALKAASKTYKSGVKDDQRNMEGFNSKAIKKQVANHMKILKKELENMSEKRAKIKKKEKI